MTIFINVPNKITQTVTTVEKKKATCIYLLFAQEHKKFGNTSNHT